MAGFKVFVYGTLKKGFRNHDVLGESKFLGEAETAPAYRMHKHHSYPFPCLFHDDAGVSIKGEVYEINDRTLAQLDRLEGHPHMYRRESIQLADVDGVCLAYFWQGNIIAEMPDCGREWISE